MEKSGREEHEVVAMAEPEVEVEEDDVMLPGFRFHPTDEELVDFYLRWKVERKPLSIEIIKEMDVYKHEPWDLQKFMITAGEKEWYFFCRRGRKYRNSVRPNRVTGCGFWKATGVDRRIQSAAHHFIGLKKSLVYYRGHAGKGTKTDWMMHEFRLPDDSAAAAAAAASATVSKNAATMQEAEVWTICRIFKRSAASYKKQPSSYQTSITTTPTKSPPESSSLTNCYDLDDYVCCTSSAGGLLADQLQLHHHHHHLNHPHPLKVHTTADLVGSGAWTSISNNNGGGQALFPANSLAMATMNEQISPTSNDFMRDSIWDELGRISEFLADDVGFPPNDSGYASYTLEIDNVI